MNTNDRLWEKINRSEYLKTISVEVISLNEKGSVIQSRMSRIQGNSSGTIHGGFIASMAESACGMSVWPHIKESDKLATVSFYLEYIAAAYYGETITAKGRLVRQGKKLVRAEAILTNQDEKIVARGYSTLMKIDSE